MMILVRVFILAGLVIADEDVLFRIKVVPCIGVILYVLSKRLQKRDVHPRYRILVFPFFLAATTEGVITSHGLIQVISIGVQQHLLNFVLKISQLNKLEKLLAILAQLAYTSARHYTRYHDE